MPSWPLARVQKAGCQVGPETLHIRNRGFLKWWYPTTMGFPTKNDHFGVFGVPPFKETPKSEFWKCFWAAYFLCFGTPWRSGHDCTEWCCEYDRPNEGACCRCGHDTAQSSSPMLLHVISIIMHHQHFDVYIVYCKRYVMRLHVLCAALEVWEISRLVENLPRTSKTPQRPSISAWFLAATLR